MANEFPRHGIVMRQPATRWQDAMPSGNGTVGTMVYGNIRQELILLNHEDLWLRTPKCSMPDVSKTLPEVRRLLDEGKYRQADVCFDEELRKRNYSHRIDPHHVAFDLEVLTETHDAFTHYRRMLDFQTGQASVVWRAGKGSYRRDVFVSRKDDVVVFRYQAAGDTIKCSLKLTPHGLSGATSMGSGKDVSGAVVPIAFASAASGNHLQLVATYKDGNQYGGLASVMLKGGHAEVKDDAIHISNAREVLVLLKLFANEPAGPALKRLKGELEKLKSTYSVLLGRHEKLHREIFDRVKLDLNCGDQRKLTNEELLMLAYDAKTPTVMIEKMADYGRYLLISSSRPGNLWPSNLQGIWNGMYDPPWGSDVHNDENIQMNYWQALPGNMPEITLPYFDYYEACIDQLRHNAKALMGCRGIMVAVAQSTCASLFPGTWLNWTAGAGWLAQLFYDYFLFTNDKQFLRERALPFLREVALFYEDFTFEGPDGKLMFSPSLSPENTPDVPDACLCTVNSTMDVAVAREVLTNLCSACELLQIDPQGVARWRAMLDKLPAYQINEDGAIKEWLHPDLKDNYRHRHISHIYALFPGVEVTAERQPELFEAMRVAVEKRLVVGLKDQTSWSLSHLSNIYARLGDGKRALECLELITRSTLGPNLFTYHNDWRGQGVTAYWGHGGNPPFQIDAMMGWSAAVIEMLVYSTPGLIKLLPALPPGWRTGSIEGVLCRGGIVVGMKWDLPAKRLALTIKAKTSQQVTVKFPGRGRITKSQLGGASIAPSPLGKSCKVLTLPKGKLVSLILEL